MLLVDDDTIRTWYLLYQDEGIEGLASFAYEGSACRLSNEQQDKLKAWITETLPRTTREIGAWIEKECGIEYQGRSGLIALLHRLGMEHRKPKAVSRNIIMRRLVLAWLARPDCRIKLHFVPAYCPHLNPIERLWGLMHKHITHNRCYARFADFRDAMLTFLREEVPRNWESYCDAVSDNFRIISPEDFRILA